MRKNRDFQVRRLNLLHWKCPLHGTPIPWNEVKIVDADSSQPRLMHNCGEFLIPILFNRNGKKA